MPAVVTYTYDALHNVVLSVTESSSVPTLGGDNLDTAGYVPYVSSAGVLSIAKTSGKQLYWDNTNGRLGVGLTTVPAATIEAGGVIRCRTTTAVGYVDLAPGNASLTGYIAWNLAAGTRQGYMGNNASGITLTMEVGNFSLVGGALVTPTATPASAVAAGVAGQWAWDSGFIYVCISTNSWKRVAIAAW